LVLFPVYDIIIQNIIEELNDIAIESKKITKKVTKNESTIDKVVKIRKKRIPAALKGKLWNKWIGEDIGKSKCICCKLTDITMLNFSCGHILAESNGGELKMDNLKPICKSCNSSMGIMDMNEYIVKFGF
jgi:5-methylcytosine-specific restriction endonuclease McrA